MNGQVIELIKAALVPFVLISGEGLIALTMQNRYGRVIDRVRELHHRLTMGEGINKEEVRILYKRGLLLRNSMVFLFSSIMFCLLTSIVTYWTGGSTISFLLFLFSLLLFFLGILLAVIDLMVSYKALEIRIKSSLKS